MWSELNESRRKRPDVNKVSYASLADKNFALVLSGASKTKSEKREIEGHHLRFTTAPLNINSILSRSTEERSRPKNLREHVSPTNFEEALKQYGIYVSPRRIAEIFIEKWPGKKMGRRDRITRDPVNEAKKSKLRQSFSIRPANDLTFMRKVKTFTEGSQERKSIKAVENLRERNTSKGKNKSSLMNQIPKANMTKVKVEADKATLLDAKDPHPGKIIYNFDVLLQEELPKCLIKVQVKSLNRRVEDTKTSLILNRAKVLREHSIDKSGSIRPLNGVQLGEKLIGTKTLWKNKNHFEQCEFFPRGHDPNYISALIKQSKINELNEVGAGGVQEVFRKKKPNAVRNFMMIYDFTGKCGKSLQNLCEFEK